MAKKSDRVALSFRVPECLKRQIQEIAAKLTLSTGKTWRPTDVVIAALQNFIKKKGG